MSPNLAYVSQLDFQIQFILLEKKNAVLALLSVLQSPVFALI